MSLQEYFVLCKSLKRLRDQNQKELVDNATLSHYQKILQFCHNIVLYNNKNIGILVIQVFVFKSPHARWRGVAKAVTTYAKNVLINLYRMPSDSNIPIPLSLPRLTPNPCRRSQRLCSSLANCPMLSTSYKTRQMQQTKSFAT